MTSSLTDRQVRFEKDEVRLGDLLHS